MRKVESTKSQKFNVIFEEKFSCEHFSPISDFLLFWKILEINCWRQVLTIKSINKFTILLCHVIQFYSPSSFNYFKLLINLKSCNKWSHSNIKLQVYAFLSPVKGFSNQHCFMTMITQKVFERYKVKVFAENNWTFFNRRK